MLRHMTTPTPSRLLRLVPVIALIALAIPASASAQATRTWVSGVGDDANPCSRTAPCKTFAGAISKTAAKGEINCLDPGGFGGVTITKSIAIKCQYTEGGVLVSGTNAIVVNAAATDAVTLQGLDVNGLGTGLNGIRIIQAKSVKILDSEIFGFVRNGVDVEFSNGGASPPKVGVYRSHIHDNSVGVMSAPPATGSSKTTIKDSIIEDSICGVVSSGKVPDPAFNFSSACGTSGTNGGTSRVNVVRTLLDNHSAIAAFSRGGGSSILRVGNSELLNNNTGFATLDAGALETWADNFFGGNTTNGTPTGTATKG
jgi:hypothetical protein